ncbi:MAG: PDZ domain-containing protein [Planctomycetota bacterium]|jgi:hypothetical protein
MPKQDGTWLHRIGRRCLGDVLGATLLAVVATLLWPAGAQPAPEAGQDKALEEPGTIDSPTPQPTSAEAKSMGQKNHPVAESLKIRPICGVVVGPDRKPVEGAVVYAGPPQRWDQYFAGKLPFMALPIEERIRTNRFSRAPYRARTDAAGRFSIQMQPGGPDYAVVDLRVVATGFGLARESLLPVEERGWLAYQPEGQTSGDVRIRLSETVPIRGRLLASDGTPVEGVLVRIRFILSKHDCMKVCQCHFNGSCDPLGRAVSEALAKSRRGEDRPAELNREPFASVHTDAVYFPDYWPRSARTDAQGWFSLEGLPAGSNVYLNLFHADYATESLIVETRPGEVHDIWDMIVASSPPPEYKPRRVPPTFSHTLEPASPVEGVVTAADTGKPLAGVFVQVHDSRPYPAPGGSYARTDRNGRYRVVRHLADRYTINVLPPPDSGYLRGSDVLETSPNSGRSFRRDFQLQRGKIIRGRVLDGETGEPIHRASIVYFRPRKQAIAAGGPTYPALTDRQGRFVVTGLSGPGCLSVETPDRSYLRSPDVDGQLIGAPSRLTLEPMTLTPVEVPLDGDLEEEVVIRLRRGRTVVLRAVGPKGERLPWVRADWDGITAVHSTDHVWGRVGFAGGRVVVRGLDPNRTRRVFLTYRPRNLGAVFDVTPETGDGPIEVPLQPTGTIVGQLVSGSGQPAEDGNAGPRISFDPSVSDFRNVPSASLQYLDYARFVKELPWCPPYPDDRFTFEYIVPGVPLGVRYGSNTLDAMITVDPLEPGERRDVGKLVIGRTLAPKATTSVKWADENLQDLLRLAEKIGIVPSIDALQDGQVLEIEALPNSPAEKAGIRYGDRITAINGRPVKRIEDVLRLCGQLELDTGLRLSLLRDGRQVEVKLTSDLLPGLFGPKVKPLGDDLFEVTFTYQPKKPAEAVYLAGSFNNWKPTAHKMEGPDQQGRYTTRLELKNGRYEYKFVLDGQTWQTDPENLLQTGPYQNSVFHVVGEP